MRKKRKEHIVARWLLSQFTDSEGKLWVYEKGKAPRRSRPERECAERDFYEYKLGNRETNNEYEDWLESIETDAADTLPMLLERSFRRQNDRAVFARFVASLFIRTRKVRDQFLGPIIKKFRAETEAPGYIRDLQYKSFQRGELLFEEDLRRQIEWTRTAIESSPSFLHLSGIKQHTLALAGVIAKKKWHVIEAAPGKSFLISDSPVCTGRVSNEQISAGDGFGKTTTSIWLPITAQHLFVASPPADIWNKVAEPDGVDSMNRLTVRFAHRNVYSNAKMESVQRLVDDRINEIVFTQNAFLQN